MSSGCTQPVIAENEMKLYAAFGRCIRDRYANKLGAVAGEGDRIELAVPADAGAVNQVVLMERIERGERVRAFTLEASVDGRWRPIYTGSCIGHKHLVRFDPIRTARLRLCVTRAAAVPLIREFAAYRA
jgi:hypothetical protein